MATFEETVIAAGVDGFWRCKELEDESHPVLLDYSGNEHHATCYETSHIHGGPSPVETDPSARSINGRAGKILASTGSLDRRNTFCWQAFGYHIDTNSPITLLSRSGHWSLSSSNIMGFDAGNARARLFIGSTTYDLSFPAEIDTFYHLALRYNAGVISFLGNGVVQDEISGVSGDMVPTFGSVHYYLGAMADNENVWFSAGVCEIGIGIALSNAQLLGIYESAINATLLTGVSNVIVTSVADGSEEADPIEFPFRHNWSEDLIERISFKTVVSQALSGPEEAKQVRPKPRREIEINHLLRDNSERRALRAKLWANQHAKWFIPILEDREIINSLASGATTIPVSTLYKDYEIGSFVQIRQLNELGQITPSETIEIHSFGANSITTLTAVANDYEGHVEICPARRAIVGISSPRGHAAEVEDLIITGKLLAEDEKTVPNRITAYTPELTYLTYEVFKESTWQSNDWSELREYEIERTLTDVDFESGIFGVETDTPGAQEAFGYRIWIKGRQLNSSFLGWFYERAGSSNYLWVASMQRDFEPLSVDGADVTVKDHHYSENYGLAEARRDVVFVYNDGSMTFRRVTGFELDGTNEVLTLDGSAGSLTNLRSLSLLKFCRLDADTLEIAKRTDDVWIYAWRFRELLTTPE